MTATRVRASTNFVSGWKPCMLWWCINRALSPRAREWRRADLGPFGNLIVAPLHLSRSEEARFLSGSVFNLSVKALIAPIWASPPSTWWHSRSKTLQYLAKAHCSHESELKVDLCWSFCSCYRSSVLVLLSYLIEIWRFGDIWSDPLGYPREA